MIPEYLTERAATYSTDAAALRGAGEESAALVYETVRDELRKCAEEAGEVARVAWDEGYAAKGLEKYATRRARNPYAEQATS